MKASATADFLHRARYRPEVIILNNPTVGVDIGNKQGIYEIIREIKARRKISGFPVVDDKGRTQTGLLVEDGKERVATGKTMTDDEMQKMDFYVAGVQGSLPKN